MALQISKNSAAEAGGFLLVESAGLLIDCSFKDNCARSNCGTSLAVSGNLDWLCIEACRFYDVQKFPVASSATRLVDLRFAANGSSAFFVVRDADREVFVVVRAAFDGRRLEETPELPPGMMREVLAYREREPPFAWRALYLLMGLLTVIISMVVSFIPVVILPTKANEGWTRQSVQKTETEL
jgi:hypothetical protein